MMVHVWDPVHCVLRLVWRSTAAARRLKPLGLVASLACGGITIIPPAPPVEAHPPPPAQTVITPPPSWGLPPPWSAVTPPAGTWPPVPTDIPLGPVQPAPEGARHTFAPSDNEFASLPLLGGTEVVSLPPGCDILTPPASKVSEPGMMGLFVTGLVLVGIWKALGYER